MTIRNRIQNGDSKQKGGQKSRGFTSTTVEIPYRKTKPK